MSGLSPDSPIPTEIKLHKTSKMLEVAFNDGAHFEMSFEYLRTHSPSAEVRGHGPGQETLQVGKQFVDIERIEPVGQYAVVLAFSDQHNTGIYSWDYLYDLGKNKDAYWADYLQRMADAGASREPLSAQFQMRPKSK